MCTQVRRLYRRAAIVTRYSHESLKKRGNVGMFNNKLADSEKAFFSSFYGKCNLIFPVNHLLFYFLRFLKKVFDNFDLKFHVNHLFRDDSHAISSCIF